MEVQKIRDMAFLAVLLCAAWQDWKTRRITSRFLMAAGCLGGILALLTGRTCGQVLLSCGVGICILALGKLTGGGIGDGDGWFFAVLGLYLSWKENVILFLSGLFLCFWVSLLFVVRNCWRRRRWHTSFPFLPFLLPGGIGMMAARGFFM